MFFFFFLVYEICLKITTAELALILSTIENAFCAIFFICYTDHTFHKQSVASWYYFNTSVREFG